MVATSSADHIFSRMNIRMVEYDADGSDNFVDLSQPQAGAATVCIPIAGYRRFAVLVMKTVVGTPGGITTLKLGGATAADGTGFVAAASVAATTADGINDTTVLECDIEQIREVVPTATFVGVKIDNEQADNEQAVTFVMADGPFQYRGLTSAFVG
jgi:hypothetical protein